MKKVYLALVIALASCCFVGCGKNASEERVKSAEEQALEQSKKAKEAVDAVNEQTNQIDVNGQAVEE